jgi:hypothetical protein
MCGTTITALDPSSNGAYAMPEIHTTAIHHADFVQIQVDHLLTHSGLRASRRTTLARGRPSQPRRRHHLYGAKTRQASSAVGLSTRILVGP